MHNTKYLGWIDLSHNYLTDLNYDFSDFPDLKSVYLHCNYIADFKVNFFCKGFIKFKNTKFEIIDHTW